MAGPRGIVTFPGILATIGGTYTFTHGITPGVVQITCRPQPIGTFDGAVGTVEFNWQSTIVRLPKCRVFDHSSHVSGGERLFVFSLQDRRWYWQFPAIYGEYNRRTADQTVFKNGRKNPRQLAALLLDMMGEGSYDVSALPIDDFPPIRWDAAIAALELERLCNIYGCHTVLQLNNSIALRKVGMGQSLPEGLPKAENSESIKAPISPDAYEVHFGATKYRVNAMLEQRGIDVDGKIKFPDKLSYKPPSTGWSTEIPGTFSDLYKSLKGDTRYGERAFIMDLARKSLFKWFQITTKMPSPGSLTGVPMKVTGCDEKIETLDQLLPIDDSLSNVVLDPRAKVLGDARLGTIASGDNIADELWDIYDLSLVWGRYFKNDGKWLTPAVTSQNPFGEAEGKSSYRPGGYSIDRERGLVMFDDYVFNLKDPTNLNSSTREWPNLALSFMAAVRNKKTHSPLHYFYRQESTGKKRGTMPLVIYRPEFQAVITHDLKNGVPQKEKFINKNMLDRIARDMIRGAIQHYFLQDQETNKYRGLWPINPDGAIQQVTLEVGSGGAHTTASYNDERHPYIQPYESRRLYERTAAGISKFGYLPPAHYAAPRNFPYNSGPSYYTGQPSRR